MAINTHIRLSFKFIKAPYLIIVGLLGLIVYVSWQAYEQYMDRPLPPEAISSVRIQIDRTGLDAIIKDISTRRPTETR